MCLTGHRLSGHIGNVVRLARSQRIPIVYGRLNSQSLRRVRAASPHVLLSAGYAQRIPVNDLGIQYNLNLHPTLLPEGRGPSPMSYLVFGKAEFSGLTIHEMTDRFDAGSIVAQQPLPIEPRWGFNELAMALFTQAPGLVNLVFDDLPGLFARRQPQGKGSYWNRPSERDRTIQWSEPASCIAEKSRRFGTRGVLCSVAGEKLEIVQPIAFVNMTHGHECGRVLFRSQRTAYIAVSDGVVAIEIPSGLRYRCERLWHRHLAPIRERLVRMVESTLPRLPWSERSRHANR